MNYDDMTREELIEALESIGAGGVSSQRITQPVASDSLADAYMTGYHAGKQAGYEMAKKEQS